MQSLTQSRQNLPAKIIYLDQSQYNDQVIIAEQDSYFRQNTHDEQKPDSKYSI